MKIFEISRHSRPKRRIKEEAESESLSTITQYVVIYPVSILAWLLHISIYHLPSFISHLHLIFFWQALDWLWNVLACILVHTHVQRGHRNLLKGRKGWEGGKKGSEYRDEGLCWLFEKITSFRFQKSYKLLCLHRLQHLLDVVVVVVVVDVVAATTQGGPGQKGLTLKFDGM